MKGAIVRKGKTYFCVYRVGGKQKWRKGGNTKRMAEKKLVEIMNDLNQGTYKEIKQKDFDSFTDEWLKNYAEIKVKPSTFESYRYVVENEIKPFFSGRKLTDISPALIQKYVAEKLKEGKKPKTVTNHLILIKEMLKHAVIWGYLKEYPAIYIEKPRVERKEMNYLTPEEIQMFLSNVSKEYYPLFLTAVLTGLRRGELLALQWKDIDFENSLIHVNKALYKDKFVEPKSKCAKRHVIMSPYLAEVLKKHKENSEGDGHDFDLVFTNKDGRPISGGVLVRRHFLPTLKRAGLKRVRFHDLRHSFATLLIDQKENIKFIQSQLGHASIQTTMDRYGHLLKESYEDVGLRLDRTLRNSVRNLLEKDTLSEIPPQGNA